MLHAARLDGDPKSAPKLTNLRSVGYPKQVPGLEVEGFRIAVNTRDERGHKPHVHAIKGRENAKSCWRRH